MRTSRLFLLIKLAFVGCLLFPSLRAQNSPRVEVFGGFSYLRTDANTVDEDLIGLNASVALNVNNWLGFAADFGWYSDDIRLALPEVVNVDRDFQTYLFGPRFTLRTTRLQPFVHALFGGARVSVGASPISVSSSGFATALGGGLDYAPGLFGWRIIQGDYLISTLGDDGQNDVRLSTGLLLRF